MTMTAEQTRQWLAKTDDASALQVTEVAFQDCRHWHMRDGTLEHDTGRFFSISGFKTAGVQDQTHVMIDQPEIGWLGFIVRQGPDGVEWLAQAKTEPGNISATQLAPSIQATRSNYLRAHGGRSTAFLDEFQSATTYLSDGPHSEQGTRFMWKFNRNSVLALPQGVDLDLAGLENWQWCGSSTMRKLLSDDYRINTDARSVIATAPWAILANHSPLFRSPVLTRSYRAAQNPLGRAALIAPIGDVPQSKVPQWEATPLDALDGWSMFETALCDPSGQKVVGCYEISVNGREVDTWCQPFLLHDDAPDHVLLMRIGDAGAMFFLRSYLEVGFGARKEYGPSVHSLHSTPDKMNGWDHGSGAVELIRLNQSDEGGRFMSTAASYRIVLTDKASPRLRYPFGAWVNLADLERLANSPGCTTNELRTLVSLILSDAFDVACAHL